MGWKALLATTLCLAWRLDATLAPSLTLEELVANSERIVHGRCLRSWSAWDAGGRLIWTHSEVQVWDAVKGGAAATITVSEPGGVVDGVGMVVEGAPQYQPGEEVVLFVYRTPIGVWRARGLGQGKYRVEGGRVRADLRGVALVGPLRAAPSDSAAPAVPNGLAVAEFKARVRSLLAGPRGGAR